MLAQYLPDLLAAISPILVALIGWVAAKLANLIKEKTKNETLSGILTRLDDAVFSATREVMMTTVDAAKAAAADGKLPEEIAAQAKRAAVARVKNYLGPEGINILMQVLGLATADTADAYISTRVEAAVHQMKSEAEIASTPQSAAAALSKIASAGAI